MWYPLLQTIYGKTWKRKTNQKEPTTHIQKLVEWMEELVCENNTNEINSPFMVTDCMGKFSTGIVIARQRAGENHLSGRKTPEKATVSLKKLL